MSERRRTTVVGRLAKITLLLATTATVAPSARAAASNIVRQRPLSWFLSGVTRKSSIRGLALMSSSSSSSSMLAWQDRTLLSVEDCLEAFHQKDGPSVKFVDGSWFHRPELPPGRECFQKGPRIPHSVHIDMDELATRFEEYPDKNPKKLPHMLPTKELFAKAMDWYGIRNQDHVIIYGREGYVWTPRTWLLFHYLGHDLSRLHLLQGSLQDWASAGGPLDHTPGTLLQVASIASNDEPTQYQAKDPTNVLTMEQLWKWMDADVGNPRKTVLLDTRGLDSFNKGHIPGAVCVPYKSLMSEDNQLCLASRQELLQALPLSAKVADKVVVSCGSGVSVCHAVLAMYECWGAKHCQDKVFIYDGSWAEWGADPDTPKEQTLPSS